jgi:hypothetical protein
VESTIETLFPVPSDSIPPPLPGVELLTTNDLVTTKAPPRLYIPPPLLLAAVRLPAIVESFIEIEPNEL